MKKLDKFILKSYLGPLVLTFSISMFVLVLQFLWRKIETLIGKGLDLTIILKMFAYASATLVPMALPLSILLASIMTFGNFGEKNELTSMRSAGIPLWRVFRPLIIVSVLFSVLAFYFASFVIPGADLRLKQIVADVREKKPAINIREKEFYTDISSYVIRVDKKDKTSGKLSDILIYDHSKDLGNVQVIRADSGYMFTAENNQTLVFKLFSGDMFSEDITEGNYYNRPLTRIGFKEQILRFDVSDFSLQNSEKDKYSDNYKVVNIQQLHFKIDSLQNSISSFENKYHKYLFSRLSLPKVTTNNKSCSAYSFYKTYDTLSSELKTNVDNYAKINLSSLSQSYAANKEITDNDKQYLARHWIEFYRKFTLAIACIILFFIGAPLGAIIRKGGLGMPVVVSIVAFVLYYIIGTLGEGAAKAGQLPPWIAMWLSSIIFFPIGLLLTIKATTDSKIFDKQAWGKIFIQIKLFFLTKKAKTK